MRVIEASSIKNYNCEKTCLEKCCNKKADFYVLIEIKDIQYFIPLCDKHFYNFNGGKL